MERHYLTQDELRHANYKYVKRDFINGKWRYWYDDPKKGKTIPKDSQGQKLAKQQYQVQQQKKVKAAVQKVKKTVNDVSDKFNSAQSTSKTKMQSVAQQQIVKQQANVKQQAEQKANQKAEADRKAKLKAEGEAKVKANMANKAAVERMNKDLNSKATAAAKESLKKAGEAKLKAKMDADKKTKLEGAKTDAQREGEAKRESALVKQTNDKAANKMRSNLTSKTLSAIKEENPTIISKAKNYLTRLYGDITNTDYTVDRYTDADGNTYEMRGHDNSFKTVKVSSSNKKKRKSR